jgi:hypothetical protein
MDEHPKRKLKINLAELDFAFEDSSGMFDTYLDLETGDVITVTEEVRSLQEQIYERYYDEEAQRVDWEAAFSTGRVPGWEQDAVREADQIEKGLDLRYIRVPSADSHEGYRDMEAFVETIDSPALYERLDRAIHGRGAFRYFKDVLSDYPKVREDWFRFKNNRLRERVLEWLESQGIGLILDDSVG